MKKRKILIVDDEVALLVIIQETFELEGYEVDTAESAEVALRFLENEAYPVMFFDIKLPGMNGIDLFKKVKKTHPDSLVYVITGHPTQFEREGCLALGFKDYFVKPILFETLLTAAEDGFRELENSRAKTQRRKE